MPLRGIFEHPKFTELCQELGDLHDIDGALEGIKESLRISAETYPILPGRNSLRMIRTRRTVRATGISPGLRVYFSICDENNVELKWIEEAG